VFRILSTLSRVAAAIVPSIASLRNGSLDKLNVASLVAQAGYAFKRGNSKRALLLLGAASIAPKFRGASYLVQGALTLDSIRRRLT